MRFASIGGARRRCEVLVQSGASGVDMGRNIFQSDCPVGMILAVRAVVHENASVKHAYEIYVEEKERAGAGSGLLQQ